MAITERLVSSRSAVLCVTKLLISAPMSPPPALLCAEHAAEAAQLGVRRGSGQEAGGQYGDVTNFAHDVFLSFG